jgi:lysozyme family protein
MASDHQPDIITVEGYSQRFADAFEELLGIEGGFVDDPVDRGGATKYGISLRFLKSEGAFDDDRDLVADYDLDFDGDIDGQDIRQLTIGDARYLYLRCFWNRLDCDSFPRPIGEMLFDQGVNGGNFAARKLLQQAINICASEAKLHLVKVDGRVGMLTRNALHRVVEECGMPRLIEAFRETVRDRYRAIVRRNPSQKRFLRGWLARAERLGA